MRYPEGALVRVKSEPIRMRDINNHGSLWTVRAQLARTGAYFCKSLATGTSYIWFEDELEDEETNDA